MPQALLKVFKSGPIERTIRESQSYFNNPAQTGVIIVTLPEPLPISETFELVVGLKRDSMKILGIFMNRLPIHQLTSTEKEQLTEFFDEHSHRFVGEWSFRRILRSEQASNHLMEWIETQKDKMPIYELREQLTDEPHAVLSGICKELEEL